jgi:DNA adenine methylase
MTIEQKRQKSLIKWAGGKGRIINILSKYLDIEKLHNLKYYEPFCGSCTVGLAFNFKTKSFNDKNMFLINFFNMVKDYPNELFQLIVEKTNSFNNSDNLEALYYNIRDKYNTLDMVGNELEHAALFWVLNHTGFNGMYRETKSGLFNIPYGKRNCPTLELDNIINLSKSLNEVIFTSNSFEVFCSSIENNSVVYLDPPYIPLSNTASFKTYLKEGFNLESHQELRNIMTGLSNKGCYVLMSNSDSEVTKEIYGNLDGFEIENISVTRSISGGKAGRGKVGELLIHNWGKYDIK